MERLPFCPDVYADALTWDVARCERQIAGDVRTLRNLAEQIPSDMVTANIQTIGREMRAVRYAMQDRARMETDHGHRHDVWMDGGLTHNAGSGPCPNCTTPARCERNGVCGRGGL